MTFIFIFVAWVFSLCLHEFSHAAVAYLGGDHTVKDKGYLTLNPLKYTDPLLSVGLPILFLIMGGFGLPGGCVYIERRLLRSRAWECGVALAGPASNAVIAIVLAAPFYLGFVDPLSTDPVWEAYAFLVVLQVCAVFFNLLPIPPLDGYGAVSAWFDYELQARIAQYSTYGLFLLFIMFWYVEGVNQAFWDAVFGAAYRLGVPPEMAWAGLDAFRIF